MTTTPAGRGRRIWISVGLCLLAFFGFVAGIIPVRSATVAPVIGLIAEFLLLRVLLTSQAPVDAIRKVVMLVGAVAVIIAAVTLILIMQTTGSTLGLVGAVIAMIMMAALVVLWLVDRRPAPDAPQSR